MARPRLSHTLALAALSAVVLGFYLWTASEGRAFPLGTPQGGHYNLLAQALAHGQLHLEVEPRPELFELVDPYDPAKNAPYRLHDASLYRGRYYLYYGVAPALALFVPLRVLGLDLPEGLAAGIFALAAFALSGLSLWRLTLWCAPTSPFRLRLVALGVLALTNGMPFVLRGPSVYEVAITAGVAFLWAAVFCFLQAARADDEPPHFGLVALGSLFLGLAVGSRPSHVFAVPLILAIGLASMGRIGARPGKVAFAVLSPLATVMALLAAYNAARFSSPFEFGTRYQLSGNHPHGLLWLDPRGILPGLYFNFLAPPGLRADFPFVFLERRYPGTLPPGYFGPELVAGVFFLVPFLLILLAARPLLRGRVSLSARGPRTVALLAAVGFLNPLVTSFLIGAANQRYEADFVSFLVVPALVVWLVVRERFDAGSKVRWWLALVMGLAMSWSAAAAVALSLTGYEDSLRRGNPVLFDALAARFDPMRVRLGRILMRDARAVVRFRLALPERPSAEVEPLVSSGSPASQDVLYVRTVGPGLVSFVVGGPTADGSASSAVALKPGHFHRFEVDFDRVRRHVLVGIEGRDPIRLAARLGPVVAGQVWLGRSAKGKEAVDLGRFSGALVSEAMDWARGGSAASLPDLTSAPTLWSNESSPPDTAVPGQLWASSVRDGAFLQDRQQWRWVARHTFDRLLVERRLTLPLGTGGEAPVLSSGEAAQADLVSVRLARPGRLVFSHRRWPGGPVTDGPAIPFRPGPVEVSVVLDRPAGRVRVAVAGQMALDASADLLPIERSRIFVGLLPKGLVR